MMQDERTGRGRGGAKHTHKWRERWGESWVSSEYREFSVHLLDAGVVNEAGIGAGASDDELGPEQLGRQLHLVVVYKSCCSLQRHEEGDRLRREWGKKRGREGGKEEVEDEYENIRGRVRVRRKEKRNMRGWKKVVRYLEDQEQTYQHGREIFFPFEAHLKQLHLKYFGYLKRGRNLSKGDISTYHIKEEDGAIAVMHSYLS